MHTQSSLYNNSNYDDDTPAQVFYHTIKCVPLYPVILDEYHRYAQYLYRTCK